MRISNLITWKWFVINMSSEMSLVLQKFIKEFIAFVTLERSLVANGDKNEV